MPGQFFEFEKTKLYYSRTGKGSNVLLQFHGFGQDHSAFQKLDDHLHAHYTVYSFDIFFHGQSEWNKGEEPLEKSFWKDLLSRFLQQHQITKFSLMGFSMGGKFALATLETFPDRVESVFLIAADGVTISSWYSLATYPAPIRSLFKSMINFPQRFKAIENFALKTKLIDKGIIRFIDSQMNTPEKRSRVYYSWVVFRHLNFDMNKMADLINKHDISVTVIVGKYDKVIPVQNMNPLIHKLKTHRLEILESGHNALIEESLKVLAK